MTEHSLDLVVQRFATAIAAAGGRALLVGGPVRDDLLGIARADIDLEVFGLAPEKIMEISQGFGPVKEVGRIFGILKVNVGGQELDVAAPRRERKTGPGHRGFAVDIDPTMTIEEAARRRDFTINAIYQDPLTKEIIDPFHGQADLENKILRVVDPTTFIEDPLRVLRAFQFAARFSLTAEPATLQLLQEMLPSVRELPGDRLRVEWVKLFVQAKRPSIGLNLALSVGYFVPWPDFIEMTTTEQGATEHPEGDVWKHTMMAVDKAQMLCDKSEVNEESRLMCGLGTFCHDTGKPRTFRREGTVLTFHGHAQAGAKPTRQFLLSQGFSEQMIEPVVALVQNHMQLHELYESDRRAPITDGALRRLLNRLKPATIQQLIIVGEADFLGRGPWPGRHGEDVWPNRYPRKEWFLERLSRAQLEDNPPTIVQGRDLIALGWKPGPDFSRVINAAETYAEEIGATKERVLQIVTEAGSPDAAVEKLTVTVKS